MASKIQLKKSNVTGRIPDPADLDWGEIALNYLDGKLFYKQHGTGTVQVLNTDTDTVTRLRGTASGTYASGDLTLLAGTNVSIAQSGTDITISANAAAEDPTKLPLTGGTVTGLVTFTHDNGSQGWSNIVIDASTAQNGAFIRANRASASTGEVGYAWGTAGTNQWINYLPTNSTTLQWYQGTAVVMSLTAAGTLNASNLTANNNQVLHAANYNSYALPLTGGTLTGSLVISGIENALDVQHNGSSVAWRGRIISRNSDSDVATFLGNYNGKSGVFSHSNALNAWAPLYLNTLGSNGGNIVYLPHANTYTISGDNTTYLILDASNYSSYALPLTGGTLTGTLTGASGTTLSFSGGSGAADSYNYVLAAANDAGNRLVVFVNGSARSADGGADSVTIRNDGGTLNLGNSSHVTNLVGSSVVTATAAAGTNTTQVATTQFVQTAIANLVDTAPATLDTLNELAAALGDDPNFATTVTNSLANKLNLTGGTLTGALTINADDGVKAIYGGTDGQTWYRGWGMESDRGAVYIRGTGNASQTLRIGYNEGSQSWNTVRVDASTFTHNGDTIWTAGNDGSGSGLDADLLDGRDSTDFVWLQKGNSGNFNVDSNAGQHATIRFSQGAWGGTNPNVGNYSHIISFNAAADNRTVQLYMGDVPGAIWWRPNQGGTQHPWERIWTPNNDGSGSGLDADLVDGYDSTDLMAAQARKVWTSIAANGANGRRYTIARVYGTPNHWSNGWQNIKIKVLQESYSSGYLEYSLFGYYGMGNGASWILRLKEADGAGTENFQVTLGPVVAAGWDYAGQPTYYQDVYVDVTYYLDLRVYATTYGHGFQTSNPTDGSSGNYTVFYGSPAVADITYSNVSKSSTYHFGDKIWNAGNDGSGSGLDADLLDGIDSSGYWTKSGGWWGSNFAGSRLQGVSSNGGEFVLIQDHPNANQVSVLVDGAYIAGENNGFWMTPGNDWNTRYGFYWNGSQIDFRQGTAPVVFGGFVGIGNSFGSDDGSWGSRLNVGGAPHARIDVRCANDGIVTTMYSHQGQNAGKMGTMSDHRLELMANGGTKASILTNGNVGINTISPTEKLHVTDGTVRIDGDTGGIRIFKSGAGAITSHLYLADAGNSRAYNFQLNADGSALNLYTYGGSSWENRYTFTAAGNVGIGTSSPGVKLDVYRDSGDSSARFKSDNGGAEISIDASNGYAALKILASGTEKWRVGHIAQSDYFQIWQPGTGDRFVISNAGNVGIGTTTPGYKLEVNGSFAATTKSFVIDHPTKPGKKLRYGSLEGPENGVYVRGRLRGTKIQLPDYWTKLVDPDSITVQLTPIGRRQDVWVTKIVDNCVHVQGITQPDCYYFVQAERVDVAKLEVEIE